MLDEDGELAAEAAQAISNANSTTDEAINIPYSESKTHHDPVVGTALDPFMNGEIRTLDGDVVSDEFAADAINYQILLQKIEKLLEKLKLDA